MRETIKKHKTQYDSKNVFDSILKFGDQCTDAYEAASKIHLPKEYEQVENIVLLGMGGSALGGHIIQSQSIVKKPFEVSSAYHLPEYVNEKTLIIATSYSGNTEETVTATKEAILRGAKIIGITTGGELLALMQKNNFPVYHIDTKNNPCNQPRFGVGYMLWGTLIMLSKLSLIDNDLKSDFKESITAITHSMETMGNLDNLEFEYLWENLKGRIPLILGAEHLSETGHFIQNQINETAKTFAVYYEIPEIHHHLLEGLKHPLNLKEKIIFLLLRSDMYSDKIDKRMRITEEILKTREIPAITFKAESTSEIAQVCETLAYGAFISYYCALLNELDPSDIPWVNYLKEQLKN